MKIGLVGIPNVGKSTIFNHILGREVAKANNFPFCTIDPNVAYAEVVDDDLQKLGELSNSAKVIHPLIQCVDIAGLVKGASKGAGLGNQFLSHIKQVDLILHVLRCFQDDNIIHVNEQVNPFADADIVKFELVMSDLNLIEKFKENRKLLAKMAKKEVAALDKLQAILEKEELIHDKLDQFDEEELKFIKTLDLITTKPTIYVANGPKNNPYMAELSKLGGTLIQIDIMEEDDLKLLLNECYKKLDLITYYTTGPKETRGWSIKKGTKARQAAGEIHTDFIDKFICAKVWSYNEYMSGNNKPRTEGKDYVVNHQDICDFQIRR